MPADAMKLAVIEAFRSEGITKTELARRIGKRETEARRILDPDHPSKVETLQEALTSMRKSLVISVRNVA
jgi:antitoxin HicB